MVSAECGAGQLVVTTDLDGIQLHAPASTGTIRSLLINRTLKISSPEAELRPHDELGTFGAAMLYLAHLPFFRRVDHDGKLALIGFQNLAEEMNLQLFMAALSGREKCLHQMTNDQLQSAGYGDCLSEYYFNLGDSAALHKRDTLRYFKERYQGAMFIHLEDDTKHAITVANEIGEQGCVFMKSTLASHPRLLRRAGVILPKNVIRLDKVSKAPDKLREMVQSGEVRFPVVA